MSYEVQTCFIGETWENCWFINGKPLIFENIADALKDIADLLLEYERLAYMGKRNANIDINDYRIVNKDNGYIMSIIRKAGHLIAHTNSDSVSVSLQLSINTLN